MTLVEHETLTLWDDASYLPVANTAIVTSRHHPSSLMEADGTKHLLVSLD